MIALLFVILILMLLSNSRQNTGTEVSILGYRSQYFHLSDGASKKMYENMKSDGFSPEMIKKFVTLEDRLLKLEQLSVCSGLSLRYEAYALSDEIKETFTEYKFTYHAKHLKQISEPHKLINRNVTC
ncbi:MAG: hypothetical protein CL881_08845 [Dehalococcoidia bacterium]|jgi:uncharacterized protein (UPF0335 family)|nr:hypothetical protein [Dehalococcoidia bacterium]|tara:strand:- start:5030 stop:5410 length:381 start_codon:yes stop_codon:yes gene_type:complete